MKRILIATVMLLSGAATADSYQDFNAGLAARNREDDAAAIGYLSSAITAPDLPALLRETAYVARGGIYAKTDGDLDAAIADFTSALKLRPDDVVALRARGVAERAKGRNADSIADLKQVVALEPDIFLLYNELLNAYIRNKDYASAIAIYSDFIAKRPKNPVPLADRARVELNAEQFDNSIADATAASALYDKWAEPHDILAVDYLMKGDAKDALSQVDKAVDRNENEAVYYLQRGIVEWFAGDSAAAARAFNQALEKDPHQNYAFMWLNIALAHQGKTVPADIAARFSDAAEAKWPGPLVLVFLGRAQPDAEVTFPGNDPDSLGSKECTARFFAGEWLASQGKTADARPLLQRVTGELCNGAPMYSRLASADLARLPGASP